MVHLIQELGTTEFEIIHRPGKKHGNADGLLRGRQCGREEQEGDESGVSGPVIATVLLTQEDRGAIRQHQDGDPYISPCGRALDAGDEWWLSGHGWSAGEV